MKKLYIGLILLLFNTSFIYAITWDSCIEKYNKAKLFSEKTRLMYIYLKSTKNCLIEFKNSLIDDPNPDFTIKAMNENIEMIDNYLNELIPKYIYPKSNLEQIPKYIYSKSSTPIFNEKYKHFIKFEKCNGIHAQDKIYTAKHCNIEDSVHIKYDLSFIKAKSSSKLETSNLDLNKKGTFKYYSMSKEGMFYNVLLKEKECKFYEAKINPKGTNSSIDLVDLEKTTEIRSNCLAIPSNSGGGVFQDNKLVGIISKTVFNKNVFLYSVVEPIHLVSKE